MRNRAGRDEQARRLTTPLRGIPKSWWWTGLIGLLMAAVLPIAGHLSRHDSQPRCALDGQKIDPLFLVGIAVGENEEFAFCCLRCAELWLQRSGQQPRQIVVTDERNRQPLDAAAAHYVRSSVFSNAPNGDRRHVFRSRSDAELHAKTFRGRLLMNEQRPFAKFLDKSSKAAE